MFEKILMIDNFDSFTFNLVDYMERRGVAVEVIQNDADPQVIKDFGPDLIVISPGPSTPENSGNLMKMIEAAAEKYPIFAVCLGLEALIEHFGGSLKLLEPVHGKASPIHHDGKTIFSSLEQDFSAGRYHSLAADRVPDCFEVSAYYNDIPMAIRHKTLPIEAVQFHPESVLTMDGDNGYKLIQNVINKKLANA